MRSYRPVVLVIMDGFGMAAPGPGNAIALARAPHLDALFSDAPWTTLESSGLAVGLPPGQMGNSEVGHLNMGAGRVVYQELTRIDRAIEDGSLGTNPVLLEAIDGAVAEGHAVHFMGLVSDGGVHSHQEHLHALVRLAASRGAQRVFVHAFLDGRDVPPTSGRGFLENLEGVLAEIGVGSIATVSGRYYAMDRDNRWERVGRAWRALALGEGVTAASATSAVGESYERGITDEFVEPTISPGTAEEFGEPVRFVPREELAADATQEVFLRVFRDPGLYEERRDGGVEPGREPVDDHLPHHRVDVTRVLVAGRQGMQVGDEEVAVILVLQLRPVLEGAVVVAEVQAAGRAHSGQHAPRRGDR